MELKKLLNNIDYELKSGDLTKNITELKYDSREIEKDNLFVAISGFETDGHQYIDQALDKGAAAVVLEKDREKYEKGVTYIKVKNSRKIMAEIAKNFFSDPLKDINLIGITGTNGKTTTSYLLYNILKEYKSKAALFGTIKNIIGEQELGSKRTTAESVDLYRYFAQMREKNIKYGVMEVSSHALDLYRVYGMDFKAAVFTNISQEHLDYHENLENYREVKSKLFSQLKSNNFAVINNDDQNSDYIKAKSQGKNYTYSLDSETADLYTTQFKLHSQGMEYKTGGKVNSKFLLNLGGIFNIYNSLAAILTAYLLGINKTVIKKALTKINSVPGRFEIINAGQDFQIVVDYAHTPDGMKNVLETAAAMEKNKLIVLFGCGGDRDRSKRPAMAELAEKYADYIIVSNDNPRSENPQQIFSEIKKGFSKKFSAYEIIADRQKAIEKAIKIAKKDDLVMLLGRGHEKYQVLKDGKIELDDRKVAYQAAEKVKGS
ncbi:MAG: UDP-N-acetylmuramoyl-L-alanyl-D-glutamate--2,6-diaminopimelate ligase [Halanaerobium sp. 4-GBenrich]|uniref:UDP-N-acetylmuramoyl-L-alanyl-D-glutamate--2,6-diaminopimelate ligase n=1 Tax=Halanaerobium congolense TaxID=54121 RepID=A0A1M7HP38_9FIRM|nr:UDP-N-acetylmuramoyl-L-alanyl-D-glutamate--2,6-diaminopimelate ligase [Halanaerobium congolense]ODS50871.1 MAG: UDP-N-acetylmuramoyl-L-alanyl-D-glutamate--2,6-diaminopimelate ligase [Halanaerobium sp. 4-GBenrich]TDX48190.1 UDP-N-acetylmuramoylalanyl-D-glutamate--2,6-diaminopimelate ligase [Halanaerobium congolense]SHM30189.1 UDP-N-acetylmuramoylalanyl-D-glutamate--2,6-diaminopimelate ligase [Halanaerobium congolense]